MEVTVDQSVVDQVGTSHRTMDVNSDATGAQTVLAEADAYENACVATRSEIVYEDGHSDGSRPRLEWGNAPRPFRLSRFR